MKIKFQNSCFFFLFQETDNYSTKTVRQRRKKHLEMSNQKFNETTAKENIKENCVNKCKSPSGDKKSQKEAKNNVQNTYKKDQAKSQEPTEALKPITNLPKSKEPFETLSSLCNDTVSLKNKRKSNVKKRTKEEKFVNLARGKIALHVFVPSAIFFEKCLMSTVMGKNG